MSRSPAGTAFPFASRPAAQRLLGRAVPCPRATGTTAPDVPGIRALRLRASPRDRVIRLAINAPSHSESTARLRNVRSLLLCAGTACAVKEPEVNKRACYVTINLPFHRKGSGRFRGHVSGEAATCCPDRLPLPSALSETRMTAHCSTDTLVAAAGGQMRRSKARGRHTSRKVNFLEKSCPGPSVRRITREASRPPNIVAESGAPWLAMRLVKGRSLSQERR